MLTPTLYLTMLGVVMVGTAALSIYTSIKINKNDDNRKEKQSSNYEVPKLKELTEEQIADIHARGKITPAEKVKEWEGMGLCAPGDAIGSAAWRCNKFRNCHDCLVDYANTHDEYTSIYDNLIIYTPK